MADINRETDQLYFLNIARSIGNALCTVEFYWPTVTMEQVWKVRADNRADMFSRYLERKYQKRLYKPAWYQFTDADLEEIKALTDDNFFNVLPECSPVLTPAASGMKPEELEAKRAELLAGL